jgi:uncharacterized membrane protein YcaP (DUF421 family)
MDRCKAAGTASTASIWNTFFTRNLFPNIKDNIQSDETRKKGAFMFFDNWSGLIRTAVIGIVAYAALVFLLRVSGKRTLSKMNAFDFVITVALGSTLATVLLSEDTALTKGVLALALLIFLQFMITWLSVRSKTISRLVKAEPRFLFRNGEFMWQAMKSERINEGEILQAMRSQGVPDKEQVQAVVLESDGSLSILCKTPDAHATVLSDVGS